MTTIWELDFYSRPVLDEAGKKRWEILIQEAPLSPLQPTGELFRYAEWCAGSEVNSARLVDAVRKAIAASGRPPERIRFFRRAMNNMITKACQDLGIPSSLSRRTVTLAHWLEQRQNDVYALDPGYQEGGSPSVQYPPEAAQPLPDALRGDRWALVSLQVRDFADWNEWSIGFGEGFAPEALGLGPDDAVPGLLVYSNRALPLAAWMSGLDLAAVTWDAEEGRLLLETGGSERWILAALHQPELRAEAERFAQAQQAARGIHFLAVQSSPESEEFAGFWLMQSLELA